MVAFPAELIKGVILAFALIIDMACVTVIIKQLKNRPKFKPHDLIKPFRKYQERIIEEEWYEQRDEVSAIITELERGVVPKEVFNYHIRGNGTTIRVETVFEVVERKTIDNEKDTNTTQT